MIQFQGPSGGQASGQQGNSTVKHMTHVKESNKITKRRQDCTKHFIFR
jgi:hypothetical protein